MKQMLKEEFTQTVMFDVSFRNIVGSFFRSFAAIQHAYTNPGSPNHFRIVIHIAARHDFVQWDIQSLTGDP